MNSLQMCADNRLHKGSYSVDTLKLNSVSVILSVSSISTS